MAGAGYRTFQSGEVLTSTNVQTYLMDQAVQVYSGTAARSSAVPSPSTGMVAYSTATGLQVFNGSAWVAAGGGYGVATGGASTAITVAGTAYTLLTFTTDANLVVSTAGLFDVLMFGGGGGGGSTTDNGVSGGGGGAGGFVQSTVYLAAATYAVDIGAGGVGTSQPTNGFCSSIDTVARSLAVPGGGFGGGYIPAGGFAAGIGGCGGGAAYQNYLTGAVSALPTVGGFAGGDGVSGSASAAGGGGVTAVGANRFSGTVGGAGGAGYDVSAFIGGSALFKGGGGGGGGSTTGGSGG